MKTLLIIFILLGLAIVFGFLMHQDAGYVLISYNSWSVETSIWVAVAATLIVFFICYTVIRLLSHGVRLNRTLKAWNHLRRTKKNQQVACRGLIAFLSGQWQKTDKLLLKDVKKNPHPLINYLFAAKAAYARGAYTTGNAYLQQAHQHTNEHVQTVILTQANLYIESEQWELALAALLHLITLHPNHARGLELLQLTLIKLQQWQQLFELLPSLRQHKILDADALTELESQITIQLLQQNNTSLNALETVWIKVPSKIKSLPNVAFTYLTLLNHYNPQKTLELIYKQLKKNWQPDLLTLIPQIKTNNISKIIVQSEKWLATHPNDPSLLSCLAQLCLQEALLPKAQEYLQQLLKISHSTPSLLLAAELENILGNKSAAIRHYQLALKDSS